MCCCVGSCQPDSRPESARRHDRSASDQRAMGPARSLFGRFRRHGVLGAVAAAPATHHRPRPTLARQSGGRCPRYSDRAHSLPGGSGRRGACVRGARLGSPQLAAGAAPHRRAGLGAAARPRHLRPARHVPPRAGAMAAAPHAPRRPRHRRDDGGALSPRGDRPLHAHQVRRGGGARCSGRGRAGLRGAAQRHVVVQPLQRAHAAGRRPDRALAGGDARHASRAPLHHPGRDRQQFRLQLSLVGPPVRHLPARAARRPSRHDHRHRGVPRSSRAAPRPYADPAVPRRCGGPRRPHEAVIPAKRSADRQSSPTLRE